MNEAITHGLPVHLGGNHPAFSFDVLCQGPDDADRRKFLDLIELAATSERIDLPMQAAALRADARALLKDRWLEGVHNAVMVGGKNDLGNKYFGNSGAGSAYTPAWYLALVGGTGTIANTDTLAAHPGWTEQTPYAGNRPAITFGTWTNGSNTASPVVIAITASATITGAAIVSAATGTSGVLYSASNFASPRTMAAGDQLTVIPTVSFS